MASLAIAAAGRDIDGDFFRHRQRLFHQFVRGHDAADEAGALGLGGIHHPAGEAQVHRLGFADRPRQPLRAADAGDGAERDLRLAEFRGVGGDDDVAHHRQFAAAAERIAADRRDRRLAASATRSPPIAVKSLENMSMKLFGCISLMSAPAAKAFSLPVSRMHPILSSASRSSIGGGDLPEHAERQRIEHFRAVQRDDADRALAFDNDVFERAHAPPRWLIFAGNVPAGGVGFKWHDLKRTRLAACGLEALSRTHLQRPGHLTLRHEHPRGGGHRQQCAEADEDLADQ